VKAKTTLVASLMGTMLLNPVVSAARKHINTPAAEAHSSISVKLYNGFLVMAVGQIGGLEQKQNFVVDTGTAPSILNARLAKKLGLEVTGGTLVAVGKAVETGQVVLPELDLGPIHVASLLMNVMDLSRWEKNLGIEVAGLLGMDVLGRASFRLDYEKKELEFGTVAQEGIAVGYDGSRGLALAEATLQGKRVRLIVDTGSDLVVVYGGSWEGMEAASVRSQSREGTSVAEQVTARQIAEPEMELGGKQFRGLRTYYVSSPMGFGYDGFFGVRALRLHGISFDRERQTMYLLN
jgi:predicted aspartyl protease